MTCTTQALLPPSGHDWRVGGCAVAGLPNVGKSTLINSLIGQPIAITTRVPGTTRFALNALYRNEPMRTQIVFHDTPGMQRIDRPVDRYLQGQVSESLHRADVILWMVDLEELKRRKLRQLSPRDLAVGKRLAWEDKPLIVALNKLDTLQDKSQVLPLIEDLQARFAPSAIVPVSSTQGLHLDALVESLATHCQRGPEPEDWLTDRSERFFVAEFVREAVLQAMRQEIPHGVAVQVDSFAEDPRGTVQCSATIHVGRQSHRRILIGQSGAAIRAIRLRAQRRLRRFFHKPLQLELWVRAQERWNAREATVKAMLDEVAKL